MSHFIVVCFALLIASDVIAAEHARRKLNCAGNLHMVDDENFGGDERRDVHISKEMVVTSEQPAAYLDINECCGDEVRVAVKAQVSLSAATGDIKLNGSWAYFEGDACNTNDEHASGSILQIVTIDGSSQVDVSYQDGAGSFNFFINCHNTSP
jgi:hypothetical protein